MYSESNKIEIAGVEQEVKIVDKEIYYEYEETAQGLMITGARGNLSTLTIPSEIMGRNVTAIAKKAFLGTKELEYLKITESVSEIGDWAFAKCRNLKEVYFPRNRVIVGQLILQNADSLQTIYCDCDKIELTSGRSRLLAMTVARLNADDLFRPWDIDENWFKRWDQRLTMRLNNNQDDVMKDLVYCAEEDMSAKQEAYLLELVKDNLQLVMERLLWQEELVPKQKEIYVTYLKSKIHLFRLPELLELLKNGRQNNTQLQKEILNLLIEKECITSESFAERLDEIGSQNTELKAYFLGVWDKKQKSTTFWDMLQES